MNLMKIFSLRVLLALSMLCGAGQALAGPVYRVTIDTAALAGKSGYLDFLLLGLASAEPLEASIGNFRGDFTGASFATGDAGGGVGGLVTIGNGAAWNEFGQWANFGGVFGFDISFSTGSGMGAGSNLGIALLDADFGYLGTAADVVSFAVQPGADIAVSLEAGVASVRIVPEGEVPEPSTVLQGLTGLLMGAVARRRVRGNRAFAR